MASPTKKKPKDPSSPLAASAQNMISQDSGKYKSTQFGDARDKKSRNEKIVGMTPSEQVLFNSNREKSPVNTSGTNTSAETI